ncbi:hypothetical protein EDD85DRAFT_949228 [Armillaria nabsnona]|nr:hypothetical protein EDD85DRAFT_949228 [Armillaria nabsnona]
MSFLMQLVENLLLHVQDVSNFIEYITTKAPNFDYPIMELLEYLMVFLKRFSKTWIIIDALDECHEEVVGPDGLIQKLRTGESKSGDWVNLKLAFLSQKESSIEKQLNGWESVEVGRNNTTGDDIFQFSSQKVGKVKKADLYLGGHARLVADIAQIARNMFLSIVLKVENLKDSTDKEMKMKLNDLNHSPAKLDDLYAKYLD